MLVMSSQVRIRAATAGDEEALALVGAATFLESFAGVLDGDDILAHCARQHSPDTYAAWLADDRHRIWIATAEQGGAPVGYAVLSPADLPLDDRSPDDWELKRIYVFSRFQGLGLGRKLVQLAAEEAKQRGGKRLLLGVYGRNEQAISFYQYVGFKIVGARRFLVGQTWHDDLVLGMDLTD